MSLVRFTTTVIFNYDKIYNTEQIIEKYLGEIRFEKPSFFTLIQGVDPYLYITIYGYCAYPLFYYFYHVRPKLFTLLFNFEVAKVEKIEDKTVFEFLRDFYKKYSSLINDLKRKYNEGEVIGIDRIFTNVKELLNTFSLLKKREETIKTSPEKLTVTEKIHFCEVRTDNGFLKNLSAIVTVEPHIIRIEKGYYVGEGSWKILGEVDIFEEEDKLILKNIERDEKKKETIINIILEEEKVREFRVEKDDLNRAEIFIELFKSGFYISHPKWKELEDYRRVLLAGLNTVSIYIHYIKLLSKLFKELTDNPKKYVDILAKISI